MKRYSPLLVSGKCKLKPQLHTFEHLFKEKHTHTPTQTQPTQTLITASVDKIVGIQNGTDTLENNLAAPTSLQIKAIWKAPHSPLTSFPHQHHVVPATKLFLRPEILLLRHQLAKLPHYFKSAQMSFSPIDLPRLSYLTLHPLSLCISLPHSPFYFSPLHSSPSNILYNLLSHFIYFFSPQLSNQCKRQDLRFVR